MKRLISVFLFAFFSVQAYGQAPQSISLPKFVPIHCDGTVAGSCKFNVYPNTTGIMMASDTASGEGTTGVTDSLGNTWQRDACDVQGNCLWRMNFGASVPSYGASDTITISPNYYNSQGQHTFLTLYDGTWTFTGRSSKASYRDASPFPECSAGNDCPYNWSGMVYAEAAELIIAWDDAKVANIGMIPKPTPPFYIEATDHVFAIEDMIAPSEGIYQGAVIWKAADGSDWTSGHWEMGIAVYTKDKSN